MFFYRVASTHSSMFSKALGHFFLLYVYGCSVFQGLMCHCCFPLLHPYLNLWHSDLYQGLSQLPSPLSGSTTPLSATALSIFLWDLDSAGKRKHCSLGKCSYHLPFLSFVGCDKCTDIALRTLQVVPDWQNAKDLHLFWFSGSNKNQ